MKPVKQVIAFVVFLFVTTTAGLIGVSAALGMVCLVWRPEVGASLVGPGIDPGHPARWVFLGLTALCGLFMVVATMGVYVVILCVVPWLDPRAQDMPSKSIHPTEYKWKRRPLEWERRFVLAWARRIRAEIHDLERARRPDPVDPDW
jgi:quinol-cytochrome oxidoreductase complex cytochrome b subunit